MAGSLALIFSQQLRSSDHNIGQFRRAQRHAPGLAEDDRRSQSTAVIARPTLAVVAGRPQVSFLLQPNVDRSAVVLLNCSERFAADVEHPKKSQRNEKILYAIAAVRKLSVCVRVSGEGNGGKVCPLAAMPAPSETQQPHNVGLFQLPLHHHPPILTSAKDVFCNPQARESPACAHRKRNRQRPATHCRRLRRSYPQASRCSRLVSAPPGVRINDSQWRGRCPKSKRERASKPT